MATIGSAGDVLPLISVGRALRERGHRVTAIAPYGYREIVTLNGLEFTPLSDEEEYLRSLRDKMILPTRYSALFFRRHSIAWNVTILRAIQACRSDELIIFSVDRPNLWGDIYAKALYRAPAIRALIDLPVLPSKVDGLLPATAVQWKLKYQFEKAWNEAAQEFRPGGNLSQLARLTKAVRPSIPTVALWPACLADTGLVPHARPFGFMPPPQLPRRSVSAARTPDPTLRQVVFMVGTEGTNVGWISKFLEVSGEVCETLNCEGTVLGLPAQIIPRSRRLASCEFAPLHEILPGAAAIVHHGGIGTSAAAVDSNVPQLIVPRVFMQPMNAEWMKRLGVAAVLEPNEYTVPTVAATLRKLWEDGGIKRRAEELAERARKSSDPAGLCAFIEQYAAAQLRPR